MASIYTLAGLIDKDGNKYENTVETVGDLQDLHTSAKNNTVAAINEVADWIEGAPISTSDIDALFSD